jgi:hypothetical protein
MSGIEGFPVEPRITNARVLRPYRGFETIYETEAATTPVSFYEVSEHARTTPTDDRVLVLDELAGKPGYEATLERFIPTPFGSRVTVWIPYCLFYDGQSLAETSYVYTFHWRIRNVPDTAVARKKGFHSDRLDGYPDTRAEARFAMPVTSNTIIVEQTEALLSYQQQQNLRRERIQPLSAVADTAFLSLLPDGNSGVRQQGILDLADGISMDIAHSESFLRVNFDAAGDELLIQARRADAFSTQPAAWTFATTDAAFSYIYGANVAGTAHEPPSGVGIYLFTGDAP